MYTIAFPKSCWKGTSGQLRIPKQLAQHLGKGSFIIIAMPLHRRQADDAMVGQSSGTYYINGPKARHLIKDLGLKFGPSVSALKADVDFDSNKRTATVTLSFTL
jgi:hypothetical protein